MEDIFVDNLLDNLKISVDKDKVDYKRISRKEYVSFKKAIKEAQDKSSLIITSQNLLNWAIIAHDFNRIHLYLGYANEAGFEHPPVHGTMLASGLEQYVNRLNCVIKDFSEKTLYYTSQTVKFSKGVLVRKHKRTKVSYDPSNIYLNHNDLVLTVNGISGKSDVSFNGQSKFSVLKKRPKDNIVIPYTNPINIIHRTSIEIKKGERDMFYENLGFKDNPENVALMHPASFIIASILDISSRRIGKPEGKYRKMDLKFYDKPKLGIFETMIKLKRAPRGDESQGFYYEFEALCTQNDKPIVGGDVGCYSPYKIKLDKL